MPKDEIIGRLQEIVRTARFDDVSVFDFLHTVMQISGTSIQIDPAAFRQTGRDANALVTYQALDISLNDLLEQALRPLKLVPVIEDQSVRISSVVWESSQPRDLSFFVGDLRSRAANNIDLLNVISRLIEPETWSSVGGPGTIRVDGERLVVHHTRRIQFQVLVFLEKL